MLIIIAEEVHLTEETTLIETTTLIEEITPIEILLTTTEIILLAETAFIITISTNRNSTNNIVNRRVPTFTNRNSILILLLETTHKVNHLEITAITHKAEQILQAKTLKDRATLQAATVPTEAAVAVATCQAVAAECQVVAVAVEELVAEEDKKQ